MSGQDIEILADFVTREKLAVEIDRSPRTLDRWHKQNIGPPRTKVGNLVLYRVAAVQRWLLENEKA